MKMPIVLFKVLPVHKVVGKATEDSYLFAVMAGIKHLYFKAYPYLRKHIF